MYSIRINFFFSNIKYKNYLYFILTNKNDGLNNEEKKGLEQKKQIYKATAKEKKLNETPIIREPSTRERKKRDLLDL